MSLTIPNIGNVGAAVGTATRAAAGRSDTPPGGIGLHVRLSRIAGLTKPGLLEDSFYFQCPPTDSWRRSGSAPWNDFDTVGFGTVSQPGNGPGLDTFSFTSLFVDYDPTWAAYHFGTDPSRSAPARAEAPPVDPLGWMADLREIRNSRTPVALLVGNIGAWGEWLVSNMPVTLRDVNEEHRGGEDDTVYFDLSLVQYRREKLNTEDEGLTPVTITIDKAGTAEWSDSGGEHSLASTTLHKLAKHFYGSAGEWKVIAQNNRNPHLSGWRSGTRALSEYAKAHGSGKNRTAKIYIPKRRPRSTKSAANTVHVGLG